MEIKNRQRGMNLGHTSVFSEKKVKYNFDLSVLDLMCSYILSRSSNIKRGNLINMRNLFDVMDIDVYEKDPEKMNRVRFIRKGIEARLEKDLKDPTLILAYINGGIVENELNTDDFSILSNKELRYIDETVSGALASTFIDTEMDKFYELYTKYKAQDYRYRDQIQGEIELFVSDLYNRFRRNKAQESDGNSFSLKEEEFINSCSDIHDKLTSPSRFLHCMMQGMNEITGGGFEATRVYLLLGMAGVGKSMLLLNLALQIKKANKGYITKDPTKIPTILFLTQENTVDETVDRICNMITGKSINQLSKEELIRQLRQEGELMLEGDNNININILYKPDRSIDTSDLYTIIEDLEDDGYEVVALIQDHIKRIRSADRAVYGDIRMELGFVMNELKILAQLKEIPIVTVSHLNRDASKIIDSHVTGTKADLTRLLGNSNVGESMLMIDNADCVLIANREMDYEGSEYIILKRTKLRYGNSRLDYICLPFESDSGTKLIEDLYNPVPKYKITLVPDNQVNKTETMKMSVNVKTSSYTNLENVVEIPEERNIFDALAGGSSKYSSTIPQNNINISVKPTSIIIEEPFEQAENSNFIIWK